MQLRQTQAHPLSTPRRLLIGLVTHALKPLARLMLRHGITLYEFIEIARWVFAHAAMDRRRFSVRGRDVWAMTKSRCAVLTGMTRRQVDRQIGLNEPATEAARRAYHRGVRVLDAWASDPDYLDKHGKRGELPLRGASGSFEQLVRAHCRDISTRSMLDELEYRGCVVRATRETVRFVHDDLDATASFPLNIEHLGQAAEDFLLLLERQLNNEPSVTLMHVASPLLCTDERGDLQQRLQAHMQVFMTRARQEIAAGSQPIPEKPAAQTTQIVIGAYCGSR